VGIEIDGNNNQIVGNQYTFMGTMIQDDGSDNLILDGQELKQTYTPTNVTTDRSYDANSTTTDELADVLGTLIGDLQARSLIN
jgi:hypothetical protein